MFTAKYIRDNLDLGEYTGINGGGGMNLFYSK